MSDQKNFNVGEQSDRPDSFFGGFFSKKFFAGFFTGFFTFFFFFFAFNFFGVFARFAQG